jgi:hypothetical protein
MLISLCEKKRLNDLVNQKRKDILFFSMFFFGGLKIYFAIYFDNLFMIYASHHYNITQDI